MTPPTLYLAPLAGVTDDAFRRICKRFGADVLCTEMVSAKGLFYNDRKTARLMTFDRSGRPTGIQLFGHEPEIMADAVKKASGLQPDFIDINMGCPMPKIVNNGDGSALMKNPVLAGRIIEAAASATDIPITVKFRSGWNENSVNAVEFARICQESGATRITVHPRTRTQMYTGTADHSVTAEVKAAVKIPVVANGDIFTPEDALSVMQKTKADGVMIARGAMGNPFIFNRIKEIYDTGKYHYPTAEEKISTALEHLRLMCDLTGNEETSVIEMRKHIAWYLKGIRGSSGCKTEVFTCRKPEQVERVLLDFLSACAREN